MKNWKKMVLAVALLGVAAIPLAGCGGKKAKEEGSAAQGTYQGLGSTESVYGVSAVTAAKLLAVTENSPSAIRTAAVDDGTTVPDAVLDEAEKFNKYFNMLDTFLDKEATTTVVEENVETDEAVKDYAFKLTVNGKDAKGETVAHTVYFTETKGETKQNVTYDEDETTTVESTQYTLEGAVLMGQTETGNLYYSMSGTRVERTVTEQEGKKTETSVENELKLHAFAEDPTTYVEISHTSETETEGDDSEHESEYVYSVYENGKLSEQTAVEFETETEKGETEAEYEVRFLTGTVKGSYEIERETKTATRRSSSCTRWEVAAEASASPRTATANTATNTPIPRENSPISTTDP